MVAKSVYVLAGLCLLTLTYSLSVNSFMAAICERFVPHEQYNPDAYRYYTVTIPDEIKQNVPPAKWFKQWEDLEYATSGYQPKYFPIYADSDNQTIRAAAWAYAHASGTWLESMPENAKYNKPSLEQVLEFFETGEEDIEYVEYLHAIRILNHYY